MTDEEKIVAFEQRVLDLVVITTTAALEKDDRKNKLHLTHSVSPTVTEIVRMYEEALKCHSQNQ